MIVLFLFGGIMSKLGSEFIEDFEREERKLFGTSYRILLLIFSVLTFIVLITLVYILELPEIIWQLYGIIVVIPGTFFGVSADEKMELKGKLHYFFLIKRRVYKTNLKN